MPKGPIEKALVGAVAAVAVVKGVKAATTHDSDGPYARRSHQDIYGPDDGTNGNGNGHRQRSAAEQNAGEEAKGPKRLLKKIDGYQRSHAWLGFPLGTVKKFGEDEAGNLAALISYYTFFSIFPLLLALVTILGFVLAGNAELQRDIVDSALANFPVIGDQIKDNVGSLDGNWFALLIGLAGALWAGMAAVDAAQNAMNSVWDVPAREKPNFFVRRLRSLVMLFVVGGGMLLTTVMSTAAGSLDSLGPLGRFAVPLASVVVNIGIFMVAFRILTQRHLTWGDVFPGAAVAGVIAAVLQVVGGAIMTHNLEGASQTYGTFAVVIGLLSWIYLQAQIALFAAEINVVRSRRLWPRSLVTDPDNLTEGDRRALEMHAESEERVPDQDVRTALPGESGERGVDRPTDDSRNGELATSGAPRH